MSDAQCARPRRRGCCGCHKALQDLPALDLARAAGCEVPVDTAPAVAALLPVCISS